MSSEAGPPVDNAFPDPTKRPVPESFSDIYHLLEEDSLPIDPPMAIICRCRPLSFLANAVLAVACTAPSTSKTFPSAPIVPLGVACACGSRLKPSQIRTGREW